MLGVGDHSLCSAQKPTADRITMLRSANITSRRLDARLARAIARRCLRFPGGWPPRQALNYQGDEGAAQVRTAAIMRVVLIAAPEGAWPSHAKPGTKPTGLGLAEILPRAGYNYDGLPSRARLI